MGKEEWELWFDRWYAETQGDSSNWIGAESRLARLAYLEAARAAAANEAASLTAIWSQLDAGDNGGEMIRARLRKIQPPIG